MKAMEYNSARRTTQFNDYPKRLRFCEIQYDIVCCKQSSDHHWRLRTQSNLWHHPLLEVSNGCRRKWRVMHAFKLNTLYARQSCTVLQSRPQEQTHLIPSWIYCIDYVSLKTTFIWGSIWLWKLGVETFWSLNPFHSWSRSVPGSAAGRSCQFQRCRHCTGLGNGNLNISKWLSALRLHRFASRDQIRLHQLTPPCGRMKGWLGRREKKLWATSPLFCPKMLNLFTFRFTPSQMIFRNRTCSLWELGELNNQQFWRAIWQFRQYSLSERSENMILITILPDNHWRQGRKGPIPFTLFV